MKKLLTLIPLIILLISCAGGAKPAASSNGMTLDQALHEAAKRIDERIVTGSKIAPLNFNSPHDKFSGYVLDELTANLVESRKLTIVDRKEVDLIRGEFDFQFSGEVGDDSMQELGRMLGAQAIISGSVTDMGDFYRIVIRVLNVQNASVEVQYRANILNDRIVAALMTGGRSESAPHRTSAVARADTTARTPSQSAPASSTAAPVYAPAAHTSVPQSATHAAPHSIAIEVTAKTAGKLFFQNKEVATLWDNETHVIPIDGPGTYTVKMVFSDREETRSVVINTRGTTKLSFGGTYTVGQPGPAGGLVFFDKGSYSDGWRYLEAASVDISGTAEWGANERDIGRTNTGRGSGRRNTQIIIEALRDTGETGRAAQIAQEIRQGGYDDWFLPSRDELNLMYENLKQKGLGRFQNGQYWTSSEASANQAWFQNFSDGTTGNSLGLFPWSPSKHGTFYVRPIRQF